MNIQQFRYVLAVVDLLNFEAAAEYCNVTQSTLSTMIGRLESEFDLKIFNRRTKPVSITPEGAFLIERFRIINHEIDTLNSLVQELKGETTGALTIGIIPTVSPYLLPLIIEPITQRLPGIEVTVKEITTGQIQNLLRTRQLDIGILALPLDDPELKEINIYSEPFVVYDCTDNSNATIYDLDELDYKNLWLLEEGHCLRTQVQKICELSNNHLDSSSSFKFESGSVDSLLKITEAQNGMTILPVLAVESIENDGQNRVKKFASPPPARNIGLITHKFFVKKKLLRVLEEIIFNAVKPYLGDEGHLQVLTPT